jgi:hypothetical protein
MVFFNQPSQMGKFYFLSISIVVVLTAAYTLDTLESLDAEIQGFAFRFR